MSPNNLKVLLLLMVIQTSCSSKMVKIEQDKEEGFTLYRVSKFKEFFDIFNVNQDGNVTEEEYIVATTDRAKRVLPSWRAKAVYGLMTMGYYTWWSNEYTGYKTSIAFDDWIQSIEKDMGYTGNELVEFALDFFHIVDVNCNEELTLNEYSKFLDIFRNTADIHIIFRAIDRDGNSIIDVEEFSYGIKHFAYDEAANSAAYIYGSRD